MRKFISIFLGLSLALAPAIAATDNFTASSDITVTGIIFGESTIDMIIANNSTAESWNFSSGTFTITNPCSFSVKTSNNSVKSIIIKNGSTNVACAENATPGTSYVAIPTTAGTYTVEPSTTTACKNLCPVLTGVDSYNAFPTCGAQNCSTGYNLSGSGSTATCAISGAGGSAGVPGSVYVPSTIASPTPSPSISPSPPPSASNSPSPSPSVSISNTTNIPAPAKASTPGTGIAGIPEGALIRATGDSKVYIVKNGYARWIQTSAVFNSYKHFDWKAIKNISTSDLTKYTEASLVRAQNDYKVYEVNGNGTKHWMDITAEQFTKSGRRWDMVYIINNTELKSYQTGSTVKK